MYKSERFRDSLFLVYELEMCVYSMIYTLRYVNVLMPTQSLFVKTLNQKFVFFNESLVAHNLVVHYFKIISSTN